MAPSNGSGDKFRYERNLYSQERMLEHPLFVLIPVLDWPVAEYITNKFSKNRNLKPPIISRQTIVGNIR